MKDDVVSLSINMKAGAAKICLEQATAASQLVDLVSPEGGGLLCE